MWVSRRDRASGRENVSLEASEPVGSSGRSPSCGWGRLKALGPTGRGPTGTPDAVAEGRSVVGG